MAFITSSLALPSLQLPSRERLASYWARTITITLWAVAIAYAAGRLARIGYEWARPRVAKVLHALAIALDGGLVYPDQPEPDPTPEPPLIWSERPRAVRQRKSRITAEAA